jgi:tetratricopeptide (TPR) repeat protein
MIKYGIELAEWKTAEVAAEEMIGQAHGDKDTALAHYQFAVVLLDEGRQKHKEELFARAHEESAKAIAAYPNFPDALWADGMALARLSQDDAAKAHFEQYVKMKPGDDPNRQRALRYISRPELARARMAPPFAITAIDGQRISMDDLQGKIVLLDFGPLGASLAARRCRIFARSPKSFRGSRWSFSA